MLFVWLRDRWAVLLAFIMVAAPIYVTLHDGTLRSHDCSFRNELRVLLVRNVPSHSHSCSQVPLDVDLPSILLALSSIAAVILFDQTAKLLKSLNAQLDFLGLFPKSEGVVVDFQVSFVSSWAALSIAVGMAILCGVVGRYFYQTIRKDDPLFTFISKRFSTRSPSDLGDSWWANWQHHHFGTVVWIAVGSIGVLASLAQVRLIFLFARRLNRASRQLERQPSLPGNLRARFVPSYVSSTHGWTPFHALYIRSVWASFAFAAALGALGYLFIGISTRPLYADVAIAAFIIAGALANATVVTSIRRFVRVQHSAAVTDEAHRLRAELNQGQANATAASTEIPLLIGVDAFPLRGFWRDAPAILLALAANAALVISIFKYLLRV